MIVFDLKCSQAHVFEVWFRSSDDYEEQKEAQAIVCPFCSDTDVSKAIMAPNISVGGSTEHHHDEEPAPGPGAASGGGHMMASREQALEVRQVLEKLRTHVEQNCENVGQKFAEEARKIHYGEAEERGIYGEATPDETRALNEEGIDICPLPFATRRDS